MWPPQTPSSVMPPRNCVNLVYGGIDNHIHRYSYGQVTSFQFSIQPSIFILISIAYSILLLFTWLQLSFFSAALLYYYFQNLGYLYFKYSAITFVYYYATVPNPNQYYFCHTTVMLLLFLYFDCWCISIFLLTSWSSTLLFNFLPRFLQFIVFFKPIFVSDVILTGWLFLWQIITIINYCDCDGFLRLILYRPY